MKAWRIPHREDEKELTLRTDLEVAGCQEKGETRSRASVLLVFFEGFRKNMLAGAIAGGAKVVV